jgi:hypothetical protein
VAHYKEYFFLVVDDQYALGCGHAGFLVSTPQKQADRGIESDPLAERTKGLLALQPDADRI